MRIIYLLCMFAFIQTASAQDYCSRLKKEVSGDKKSMEMASPFDPNEKPTLRVIRNVNTDEEFAYDNFFMIFRMELPLDSIYHVTADGGQVEREEQKLVVEFDDQSKIVDDTVHINHDVSDDRTQAVRYIDFPITETNLKDFSTKKIIKFSLAGTYQPVAADSANSIMQYVQCMKKAK